MKKVEFLGRSLFYYRRFGHLSDHSKKMFLFQFLVPRIALVLIFQIILASTENDGIKVLTHQKKIPPHFENAQNAPKKTAKKVRQNPKLAKN
jgi:hypothetical protein